MRWLAPPHPPCTPNIEVQTDHVRVREEGTRTKHSGAHWRCFHGRPYCHFGVFHCYSCMAREGRESKWSDSNTDGSGKMPVSTLLNDWLETYLSQENAGKSVACLWHSSSVCVVCLTGYNSDTLKRGSMVGSITFVVFSCQRLRKGGKPRSCL